MLTICGLCCPLSACGFSWARERPPRDYAARASLPAVACSSLGRPPCFAAIPGCFKLPSPVGVSPSALPRWPGFQSHAAGDTSPAKAACCSCALRIGLAGLCNHGTAASVSEVGEVGSVPNRRKLGCAPPCSNWAGPCYRPQINSSLIFPRITVRLTGL